MNKETKAIIKVLEQAGWRVERKTRGFMAFPPDKTMSPVTFHVTNSDRRSAKNFLADLRRSGWKGDIPK